MIEKVLVISTAHVSYDDKVMLEDLAETKPKARIFDTEYGFIIKVYPKSEYTEEDDQKLRDDGMSEAFIDLLKFCRKHDCPLLHLDCDADTIEDLPTFDW
jgi:hypothetical protein